MSTGVVIIGAGQGGLQAAISLRKEGYEAPITLIGDEPGMPYQRPPLSKAYLKDGDASKLALRAEAFFADKQIQLLSNTRADKIDRNQKTVAANDHTIAYDKLILATGSRNLVPPIEGVERCFGIRTLQDAEQLRSEMKESRNIAVIGGGFIGLEFAAVATAAGHTVSVAEAGPRLMARAISAEMSERFLHKHQQLGASIHLDSLASEVTDAGVQIKGGSLLPADLVVLGVGIVPNTELAQDAGLTVDNGIVVNDQLRTTDENIYALGDCARFPEPCSGMLTRLESVQAATDHARFIAQEITGKSGGAYNAVPWFWSDQADWKLQIAGLANPDHDAVTVNDNCVYRFDGEKLSAVETINDARSHMLGRKILNSDKAPTRTELAQSDYQMSLKK